MREQIRKVTGAEVGNVQIHRGPAASARAASVGAAAFAQGENVVLPADLGALSDDRTKGLLAHELTHVVQQRRFRGDLPTESSPVGRALEEEAKAVERHVRDHHEPTPVVVAAPVPEPPVPPVPAAPVLEEVPSPATIALSPEDRQTMTEAASELVASGLATAGSDGALYFGPARAAVPGQPSGGGSELSPMPFSSLASPTQSEAAPVPARRASDSGLDLTGSRPLTGIQRAEAPAEMSRELISATPGLPALEALPPEVPQSLSLASSFAGADNNGSMILSAPPPPASAEAPALPSQPAAPETSEAPKGQNKFQMPNERDLDELAKRLYNRIRRQLRSELVVERERVGLIADLR